MSAYADFDYVKEAIHLGCSDYILKPIDELELERSLRSAIEQIRGKAYEKKRQEESEEKLRLLELFKYMRGVGNKNKIVQNKSGYGFQFEGSALLLIQQKSDSMNEFDSASNMELMGDKYAATLLREVVWGEYHKKCLSFEDDAWLVLVEEMEEEQLLCLIRRVIAVFLSELNMQ